MLLRLRSLKSKDAKMYTGKITKVEERSGIQTSLMDFIKFTGRTFRVIIFYILESEGYKKLVSIVEL